MQWHLFKLLRIEKDILLEKSYKIKSYVVFIHTEINETI